MFPLSRARVRVHTGQETKAHTKTLSALLDVPFVGHGGALVEAITLNRRVVGSTPALAAM